MALRPTQSGSGFLSFNSMPPRLHITADTDDFDVDTIQQWRDEGFDVTYLPYRGGGPRYAEELKSLADDLELGEAYALIAYGQAARDCLIVHQKPMRHLAALVCYYPTDITNPAASYPTQMELQVHLAASQGLAPQFPAYVYDGVSPGFAENDLDTFDPVAAGLSWSRTLAAVRRGFKMDVDLERAGIRGLYESLEYPPMHPTIKNTVEEPYVHYIPSQTGGVDRPTLSRFYRNFFAPLPPSLSVRLVSRVSSVDRIVSEFIVSFRHTHTIPFMLPGVPPTNKPVQIPMVSIVTVRGQKLDHEHVYWDQASVLEQIGGLDPKAVPDEWRRKGCQRLPVVGVDQANGVYDIEEVADEMNGMVKGW